LGPVGAPPASADGARRLLVGRPGCGADERGAGGAVNVLTVGEATVLELVGAFDRDPDETLMSVIDAALDSGGRWSWISRG
jgi:hypothetical protein